MKSITGIHNISVKLIFILRLASSPFASHYATAVAEIERSRRRRKTNLNKLLIARGVVAVLQEGQFCSQRNKVDITI